MVVFREISSVMGFLQKVVNLIEKSKERGGELSIGLSSIKYYFELLNVRCKQLQLKPEMQLLLQELAFDVEDFIQRLCVRGPVGSFVLTAIGVDNRTGYIGQTKGFEKRIKDLKEELPNNIESRPSGGTSPPPTPAAGSPIPYAQEVDLVGVEGPKKEIKELLSRRADPHGGRIAVISIVGCSGSGKTALARALYEDDAVTRDFHYKTWVVASDSDPSSVDILNKILREVVPASAPESLSEALQQFINKILRRLRLPASTPGSTSEALQNFLNKILRRCNISQALEDFPKDKRYLVFLDDVQPGAPWEDINKAFSENSGDSRIIVTTSVASVARACSSGSYMYTMQDLDQDKSRTLFREKFRKGVGCPLRNEDVLREENINSIVNKCDGLPMALITAAKFARLKGTDLTSAIFGEVSRELREYMAYSESDFELKKRNKGNEIVELRRALVKPYENILDSGYKDCLLYGSIFPRGHKINSKSLVRRLIAEGLVPGDVDDVCEWLRTLIDQLMIEPVPIRNYYHAANRCRVRGIMLEFIIKKAVSRNFASLIQENQSEYNTAGKVRRLTVQSSPNVGRAELDLSALRSLAIFSSGIPNFEKCQLVRVLDIEDCSWLTKRVLLTICRLLKFLKYLSLRNTDIQELPKGLGKLTCLETLDTRESRATTILPVEIIMLPQLAYLFGKFELKNVGKRKKELERFFSGDKSKLHTLGGICLDETEGLKVVLLVIQHATKLKKVKVWCKGTLNSGTTELAASLETAIRNRCSMDRNRPMDLESLSIDFNGVPNTFLGLLETISTTTIGSIKLRKGFGDLPVRDKLKMVRNLSKLHLLSTGCTSKQLAALQYLQCLQYLKLSEDADGLWDIIFHVKVGGFKSLIWLCFEAPKLPPMQIDEGAMSLLASLQVLCPEVSGFTGIPHLARLNEVILHRSTTDAVVKAWKEEAKRHINRPYVEKEQV